MPKNKTSITVGGKEYTIVSEEKGEYVHRVAYYVDEKMKELGSTYVGLSTVVVATLTALNLADELFKARETLGKISKETEQMKEALRDSHIQSQMNREQADKAKEKVAQLTAEAQRTSERIKRLEQENAALRQRSSKVTNLNNNTHTR